MLHHCVEEQWRTQLANRWLDSMRRGDFADAWRQTDLLERSRASGISAEHGLMWTGEDISERRVSIHCRHGLGDSIQFLRYGPMLQAIAKEVTVLVQPTLLDLFQGARGYPDVRNGWDISVFPQDSIEIECMELPYVFRSTLETIPKNVPYLDRDLILAKSSGLEFPARRGLRVGIACRAGEWDPSRSVPDDLAYRLATETDVQLFAIHPMDIDGIFPLYLQTGRILDLANAMLQMDLVLTIDSMPAHLAGALGVPVWLLLKPVADWRWMNDRSDSPWYPTMRIFRQCGAHSWRCVEEEVLTALGEGCATRTSAQHT